MQCEQSYWANNNKGGRMKSTNIWVSARVRWVLYRNIDVWSLISTQMIVPVGQVGCTYEKEKAGAESDRCPKRYWQRGVRVQGRVHQGGQMGIWRTQRNYYCRGSWMWWVLRLSIWGSYEIAQDLSACFLGLMNSDMDSFVWCPLTMRSFVSVAFMAVGVGRCWSEVDEECMKLSLR